MTIRAWVAAAAVLADSAWTGWLSGGRTTQPWEGVLTAIARRGAGRRPVSLSAAAASATCKGLMRRDWPGELAAATGRRKSGVV